MTRAEAKIQFDDLFDRIGLSIDELAKEMGCSARTVYSWKDASRKPNMMVLKLMGFILQSRSGGV